MSKIKLVFKLVARTDLVVAGLSDPVQLALGLVLVLEVSGHSNLAAHSKQFNSTKLCRVTQENANRGSS
mgnify:CR=1 FL=1